MAFLAQVYRYLNALSIDIAIGAVCSSLLIYNFIEVQADFYVSLALGLSVWLIYTLDHLLDAQKVSLKTAALRHLLHIKYYKILWGLWISVLLLNAYICLFHLNIELLLAGFALLCFIGLHHILNIFYLKPMFWLGKEVRIAFGYSLGISLGPIISVETLSFNIVLLILIFFILALINLMFFSLVEKNYDLGHNLPGMSSYWPDEKIIRAINYISSLGIAMCILLFILRDSISDFTIPLFLLLMLLILEISTLNYKKIEDKELYRLFGDGIFLLPILLIWF